VLARQAAGRAAAVIDRRPVLALPPPWHTENARRLPMKRLLPGMFLGLVMIGLGAYVFLYLGLFPIAATSPADLIENLAPELRDRAIARQARSIRAVPGKPGAESIARGLVEYRESCMPCHGAPDGSAAEFSQGLNPGPPPLEIEKVQKRPEAELFWIVKNGIRMTGMPAFGLNHSDEEIGDIVRFLRHLPKLTDEEKAQLQKMPEGEEHHH
jgi:mono/diheme cytochrome c family protein